MEILAQITHGKWIKSYNTGAEMEEAIEILFATIGKENSDEECEDNGSTSFRESGSITDTAFEDVSKLD
jgi:hypothetical protein